VASVRVGLIGDYSSDVRAHGVIAGALAASARTLDCQVAHEWLATSQIRSPSPYLIRFDALWCVPGGPYASLDGALAGIRFAREHDTPFLGTCAGFQHAILEYARDVRGLRDAEHAEYAPDSPHAVITRLACSLVGHQGPVRLLAGSRAAALYGTLESTEQYHCNYGLDAAHRDLLADGPMIAAGWDEHDEPRVIELTDHPFFLATLFQPELSATSDKPHPLITGFVAAAKSHATARRAGTPRSTTPMTPGTAP
jgi:CTP synthase (UTP-ammonia lyase)